MKNRILLFILLFVTAIGQSQVTGNPTSFQGGVKPTRIVPYGLTTTQKNAIASPTNGTKVYDVTLGRWEMYNGTAWIPDGGGGNGIEVKTTAEREAISDPANGRVIYDSDLKSLTWYDLPSESWKVTDFAEIFRNGGGVGYVEGVDGDGNSVAVYINTNDPDDAMNFEVSKDNVSHRFQLISAGAELSTTDAANNKSATVGAGMGKAFMQQTDLATGKRLKLRLEETSTEDVTVTVPAPPVEGDYDVLTTAGTMEGRPIVGDVQFTADKKIASADTDRYFSFDNTERAVKIHNEHEVGNGFTDLYIRQEGIEMYIVPSDYSTSIDYQFLQNGFSLSQGTTTAFLGITGQEDYTANWQALPSESRRLAYPQWGAVIDAIDAAGGGSTVTSVNTQTGDVVLNQDNIADGTVNKGFTDIEKTKLAGLSQYTDAMAQAATISQFITDGVTDKSPSEDKVFDALSLKVDVAGLGYVDVKTYGAIGDGTTLSTTAIQTAITNNVGKVVKIGSHPSEVFLINKEIIVPAGSIIQIDGEVKLVAAPTQLLTANVSNGQNTIQVTDGSLFQVGQKIVFSDDNQPINGGGAWKTRKVGTTGVITAKPSANTLQFANNFTGIINGGVTVAANAKIALADNMFTCDNSDNTIIFGKGVLNGNKANRWSIAGATYDHTTEDLTSNCGISFSQSDNFRILGNLTIKDFVMHGISTQISGNTKSYNCIIEGVTIDGVVDKSICVADLVDSRIGFIRNKNGVDEGEISFYSGNYNVLCHDTFSEGNKRYGIGTAGNFNGNLTFNNNYFKNNSVAGFYLQNQLEGTNISNQTFTGATTLGGGLVVNSCRNVNFKNINFNGMVASTGLISIGANTAFASTSEGIYFDGLGIKNCNTASSSSAMSFDKAVDVSISNFVIDGVGNIINDVAGINENIKFQQGVIKNISTAVFLTNNGKVRFSKVTGDYMFETSSTATIPSAGTYITITHGLAVTPKIQDIRVNPIGSLGSATRWWVADINSTDFKIRVDAAPGVLTAKFRWNIETYLGEPITEAVYTTNYTSDFSAGSDGFALATATTTTGNNDGVTDGTTSYDDVLKISPTAVAGTHTFSKACLVANKQNRVTFKYFVPNGQAMNGFRLYHNVAMTIAVEIIGLTTGREKHVTGTWVEVTSGYFTPTGTSMYGRLFASTANTFTGVASESINIKDFKVEYLP